MARFRVATRPPGKSRLLKRRLIGGLLGIGGVLAVFSYLAFKSLPRIENTFTTPEWIGPVQVVDVVHGRVIPDVAIRVRAGRIAEVVPVGELLPEARTRMIDVGAAFVSPGLWDMHAVLTRYAAALEHPLNLAHGITRVRSILNSPSENAVSLYASQSHKRQWNEAVRAGEMFGSLTAGTGSYPINGPGGRHRDAPPEYAAGTPDEARQLVAYIASRSPRLEHIKTYDGFPRAAFFALMEEARRRGIEVSGHVPAEVSVAEASAAGFKAIAHARVLPIACSSAERRIMDLRSARAPASEWMRNALETQDRARAVELWRTLNANGTFVSPTLITRYNETRAGLDELRSDATARRITPRIIQWIWSEDVDPIVKRSAEVESLYVDYYRTAAALTAEAERAGVLLLVGSDTNDLWVAPGVGFHQEIELWRRAGIPPAAILRAATINPARYFGAQHELGQVAPGYIADLVFTRDNPLQHLATLRRPTWVMQEGRLYSAATLHRAIDTASAAAGSWRFFVHFLRDFIRNPGGFAS